MITINIHASFQRFTDGTAELTYPAPKTLNQLLTQLTRDYPPLKTIIFDTDEKTISPFIVIYINSKDARNLDFNQEVPDHAEVDLITSLVGG